MPRLQKQRKARRSVLNHATVLRWNGGARRIGDPWRVLDAASPSGSGIELYDFFIYITLAALVFDEQFFPVLATCDIKILKTPYHTPRANAICERFLGSVRRECLDHLLILSEKQLYRVLRSYVAYFNQAQPHQSIQQQIPELPVQSAPIPNQHEKVIAVPVLGGLHHDYRRVA